MKHGRVRMRSRGLAPRFPRASELVRAAARRSLWLVLAGALATSASGCHSSETHPPAKPAPSPSPSPSPATGPTDPLPATPAEDKLQHARELRDQSKRDAHDADERLAEAAAAEERADKARAEARHLWDELRLTARADEGKKARALSLLSWAGELNARARLDDASSHLLHDRARRLEQAREDLIKASEALDHAATETTEKAEKVRLEAESRRVRDQSAVEAFIAQGTVEAARQHEEAAARLRAEARTCAGEAGTDDSETIELADPKLHELDVKAKKAAAEASRDHDVAVTLFETAAQLEEKSDRERHEADRLDRDRLLSLKGADADKAQAELLRGRAERFDAEAMGDERAAHYRRARAERDEVVAKDLEASSAALTKAEAAEADAKEKPLLAEEAALATSQAEHEHKEAAALLEEAGSLDIAAKNCRDHSKKLRDEAQLIDAK